MAEDSTETVTVRKLVPARRDLVFRAWTDPAQVKRWWSLGTGWTTNRAEIDLKVGGRLLLGNQPSGGGAVVITGEFVNVEPPNKLVYTWRFPGAVPEESLVTVEFNDFGDKTEVVITHERSPRAMAPGAIAGWKFALEGLTSFLI